MSIDEGTQRRTHRGTAAWGLTFVVLLLVSAGMASVPGGDDSVVKVRDFYLAHTGIIVTAQVIGLVAAAVFVPFVRSLGEAWSTSARAPWVARLGYAVAAAAVVTVVPVLWLYAVAGDGSGALVHRLARASDLVDVVLFTAIAAFAVAVALVVPRAWLGLLSWVVAALALVRAVLLATGSEVLELVAPLAFVTLVLALSLSALTRPRRS